MRGNKLGYAAAIASVAFVVALVFSFRTGGVEKFISGKYTLVSRANTRSAVYSSTKPASTVFKEIIKQWKPGSRHNDAQGWYLRYSDAIVVVTPATGGSRIFVDEARTGYRRWYTHVGGRFGTYSGPAEGFRGGGPGAGK
jgi:Domain of unknown function (DUF4247)